MINVLFVNSMPECPLSEENMMVYLQDSISGDIITLSCVKNISVGQKRVNTSFSFAELKDIDNHLDLSMRVGSIKLITKEELNNLKKKN